ncbi:MAG: hypothetical protein KDD38_06305 [Bdellovibrionales bacterium]|nr:hypothetical protein [Bdellovibrionales bacterium]
MNFLKSNFWEIDRSPLLHYLGAILSFLHILNYFFWKSHAPFLTASATKPLLCWEFFESCIQQGLLTSSLPQQLFSIYIFVAVLAFLSFLWKRFVRLSWSLLFAATLIQMFLYISDASLKVDVQGLLIFLNLCFLFVPNKAAIFRVTIILFYLLSAFRELNPEWLSGSNLTEHMPFPLKGLEWVTAMGIGIKLTLPFLLISPFGQRLAIAACGLILFHAFHFYFERDFSSLVMIFLVFFYVLDFFVRKRLERETMYQSYEHPEPSKIWWPIAAIFYLMAQANFVPTTSPTRLFHVDGPVTTQECRHISFANFTNRVEQVENENLQKLDRNVQCHPLVAFNSAKEFCDKYKNNSEFKSLSSYFLRRRLSETDYTTVFSAENICTPHIKYSDSEVSK